MSEKIKAKVIGFSGNSALAIQWLPDPAPEGSINICGPAIDKLPLNLVPETHRVPNSLVLVSLSDRYTVSKVEIYEKNT